MFTPYHCGLYFPEAQVAAARKARDEAPFAPAWAMLRERDQDGSREPQWRALRYRFEEDTTAAEDAIEALRACLDDPFQAEGAYIDGIDTLLMLAQAIELLRAYPFFDSVQADLLTRWDAHRAYLETVEYQRSYVETLWLAHLRVVGGVLREDAALLEQGAEEYRRVVREDIHPQGYLRPAVEAGDGGGLFRQLFAVRALVLMAEAAAQVGVDLWGYSFRGVSTMTGFSYLLYYYFFPEKWRWDQGVTNEPYRDYGGFFEMVNRRFYPKDLKPILDELRPIYDPAGGGLTTLTHGVARKRGLFG